MAETYTMTAPVEAFASFTIDLKELGELVSPHIVTDNDNTEQVLGVNEIEEMISDAIENKDLDYRIGEVVCDRINYDYDFVSECDVANIVRDCIDDTNIDLDPIREEISVMRAHIMSMQAEIDFLHEKHVENVERRIGYHVSNFVSNVRSLPARLWARVPKFTITRKDNNNG